jgi:hypothetical protein
MTRHVRVGSHGHPPHAFTPTTTPTRTGKVIISYPGPHVPTRATNYVAASDPASTTASAYGP